MVYIAVTIEILSIFYMKFSFHFDPYNFYGLALKEPASFLLWFLFAIMSALRFNTKLNIYFGVLWVSSYITLLVLGFTFGDVQFIKDHKLIFTPNALRLPTEFGKIAFIILFMYFVYLMSKFTTKYINDLQKAKVDASKNFEFANNLLGTAKKFTGALFSGSKELTGSTNNISSIVTENNKLFKEVADQSQKFSLNIGEIKLRLDNQDQLVQDNFVKIKNLSG